MSPPLWERQANETGECKYCCDDPHEPRCKMMPVREDEVALLLDDDLPPLLDVSDSDDDDDDFETMKTPLERALERRPLLRGTPVMSIFLSRVPVEELRRRYGEQTNAAPP